MLSTLTVKLLRHWKQAPIRTTTRGEHLSDFRPKFLKSKFSGKICTYIVALRTKKLGWRGKMKGIRIRGTKMFWFPSLTN
jgi:hypothetical protein